MSRIETYDTTLRDGMQGEGMSLSAEEKLRVVHRLDELGIDLIEAGFPSSSRRCATRSFSGADSDIPSPCIPSRRVVS